MPRTSVPSPLDTPLDSPHSVERTPDLQPESSRFPACGARRDRARPRAARNASAASPAVQVEPENAKALFRRALSWRHVGRLSEAEADLQKASQARGSEGSGDREETGCRFGDVGVC